MIDLWMYAVKHMVWQMRWGNPISLQEKLYILYNRIASLDELAETN